ncbi:MAG: aldehyde dehydrogenase family protein, partial [Pseudomonadota bacterium]|nr:aldehyde dehydrogenase family protein [Pseudomonadota bacterium]
MFTSINPATGAAGESFAELTAEDVETRVARAATAYKTWRATDYETRTALLSAIA